MPSRKMFTTNDPTRFAACSNDNAVIVHKNAVANAANSPI